MDRPRRASAAATCASCTYFRNDPREIEEAFPGLSAMSSGFASVRAQDGLCARHGVYLSAADTCAGYRRAVGLATSDRPAF